MWLTKFALKRPVTVSMIFACSVVMGLFAGRMLPLEFFPVVQFPGIFVQANYSNSSPEEIERNITRPLEETLSTMSGIEYMQSTSSEGNAQLFMLFDWDVNAKLKGVEAREKVDAVRDQLPDDLRRVFIFTGSTNDQPIIQARLSSTTDLSDSFQVLNRVLKQRLERIEGVSKVEIHGVAAKTYQIKLLPDRMAAYHINANDLFTRLQQSNALTSAGEIKDPQKSLRITVNQQFSDLDAIRNFVINDRGLVLSDVADVRFAKDEIKVGRHLNREYAVGINVTREAGSNLVETARLVVEEMKSIEKLPDFEGIDLFVMDNQGDGVTQSLEDITYSGLIGFVLSTLVLFAFLRDFKMTLIVSLAVPFSLTITLAVMYFIGMTLNILSMMGLMLAIGMLVDNAVVISESIFGYREKMPDKPQQAALLGVKDVGIPVLAGTLTTAIVFLPNIIGEKISITVFLSHVALTIVISLMASLFIATTIIPLLLSRLKSNVQAKPILEPEQSHGRYSNFLSWLMTKPLIATLLTIGFFLPIVVITLFGLVQQEQGGQNSNTQLQINYNVNGSYELERVELAVTRMENFLYDHMDELDIKNVYSYYTNNDAGSTLLFKDENLRQHTNEEIRKFVEKNMPKLAIAEPGFQRNRGGQNGFGITVRGDDTGTLLNLSENIAPLLRQIKGVSRVTPASQKGSQEVRVILDAQRLHQLGITPETVATTISIGLRKQQLKTFRGEFGEIDISVTFDGQDKATISDLTGLPIELPDGRQVRLDGVAKLEVSTSLPRITRTNRRTGIDISIEYSEEDITSEELRKKTTAIMGQVTMPDGYSWDYGRGVFDNSRAIEILQTNMLLAVLMIFIVMAALFESLMFPIAVVTSIVYSFSGVYLYFLITGTNMSLMGMIGMLVLMGIVVNNGIVLIDRINHYRSMGYRKKDAILHAGNDRIRPILMTVLTTILGLLPLSLGDARIGGGGPPYFPMARAVIGGLGYSTIATLICLPIIYLFLDWMREFYSRLWNTTANRTIRFNFSAGRLIGRVKHSQHKPK